MTQPYLFPRDGKLWMYEKPSMHTDYNGDEFLFATEHNAKAFALEVENHGLLSTDMYYEILGGASLPLPSNLTYELVEIECDLCDGCGWYEGGPTLRTHCKQCDGTGISRKVYRLKEKEVEPVKVVEPGTPMEQREAYIAELRAENARLSEVKKKLVDTSKELHRWFRSEPLKVHSNEHRDWFNGYQERLYAYNEALKLAEQKKL